MNDEELKTVLETAGFSPYQADAYVALIKLGSASAAEVADESGVPGPRIYDIIRDLDEKGYVEMYDQGTLHARIHDPTAAARALEERAEKFSTASEAIQDRWEQPTLDNHSISIVQRFETVLNQAVSAIPEARNQIQLAATPDQFEALVPELQSATSNGAHVRVSLHPEDAECTRLPDADQFEGACTEVRHRELPSPFMLIVDRNRVFFSPHRESVDEYGVIVNDPTHAYVFHSYFLTVSWRLWETLYTAHSDEFPRSYVDMRDCVRVLDRKLAEGATISAEVRGTRVDSGEPIQLSGEIVGTRFESGPKSAADSTPDPLSGVVSIVLETDDGTYTAGGWGAMIEDIEATRVTVTNVEYADE